MVLAEADALFVMGTYVFSVGLGSWLSIANVRQAATADSHYGDIEEWRKGLSMPGYQTSVNPGKNRDICCSFFLPEEIFSEFKC